VDGGYRLNGGKYWITNSPISDLAVVWAKLDGVIRGFIVERGFEGFTTTKIGDKLSLRASITGDIGLTDVFVPEANMLPGVKGLRGPFSCLNKARYGIAWGAMGAAEFCLHATRDYVGERMLFGRPLSSRQLVQKKLADMQTEIFLGFEGAYALGRLIDTGAWVPEAIPDEAQQLRQGPGHRPRGPRHARRRRHHRRDARHAPRHEPRDRQHLRRRPRRPRPDPGPGDHRRERFLDPLPTEEDRTSETVTSPTIVIPRPGRIVGLRGNARDDGSRNGIGGTGLRGHDRHVRRPPRPPAGG
jgi:hypothetical protein